MYWTVPCRGFPIPIDPRCPGIYSILLTSAAGALGEDTVEAASWVRALRGGLDAVMLYGGARPGDRTMVWYTLHVTRDTRVHTSRYTCSSMIHIDTRDTSNVQIDALHPALLVLEANTARLGSDTAAVVREAAAAAVKVRQSLTIFLLII